MASGPSWLHTLRSVSLGRFRSSSPLVFFQVPRCQALYQSQTYTLTLVGAASCWRSELWR